MNKKTLQRKTRGGIRLLLLKVVQNPPKAPLKGRGNRRHYVSHGLYGSPMLRGVRNLLGGSEPIARFDRLHSTCLAGRYRSQGYAYFVSPEIGDIIDSNRWFFDAVEIVYGKY